MRKLKNATEFGLPPHWKVRVYLPGGILHLLSAAEPEVIIKNGVLIEVEMDLIEGTEHGDSLGFIRWSEAIAIAWRYAPSVKSSQE